MKFFKKTKGQTRRKPLDWMTVTCRRCSTDQYEHTMYVRQTEIQIRCTGYKGKLQFFAICDKCGEEIILQDERIPKRIWNFLWAKAYQAKD